MSEVRGRGNARPPGEPPSLAQLHLWEIQPLRDGLFFLAVAGILWFGYALRTVTVPLLLALTLAYLLEPLVGLLHRRFGMKRPIAAVVIVVSMVVIVLAPTFFAGAFALAQAIQLIDQAPVYWERAQPRIAAFLERLGPEFELSKVEDSVKKWLTGNAGAAAATAATPVDQAFSLVLRVLGKGFYFVFLIFIVPFFFYFICVAWPRILGFLRELIPRKQRERTLYLVGRMDRVVSGFVRGRLVIAFVLGVFHAIGWALCGVPAAILLGLFAGALSIIPFAIVLAWPAAIALLWLDQLNVADPMEWWAIILWPTVVYVLGQVLEGYILTPIIQGKVTSLDTATIVAAALGGASIGGLYGALLALPVAACIKILLVEVVWPRFKQWTEGKAPDPLPIGGDAGAR